MNANEKFLASDAHVDAAAIKPLPNSRKVYVAGSRPDIQVPMREISQDDTPTMFGGEKNPPIYVYDCSGPYSDPQAKIDIRKGLPALRAQWIAERGDTETLTDRERAANEALMRARITQLWQTRMLRYTKLTVADEIENALSYYQSTFLRQIPRLYAEIEEHLAGFAVPSFLRMGQWIGGDRDGNPNVTADTLQMALARR